MNHKISVKAAEDIENIWLYTYENWSLEQADRYLNLIFDEIEFLADNPDSGKDFNSIRKKYRYSTVKSHLIFYRQIEKPSSIEVMRVLHQRMDIKEQLAD